VAAPAAAELVASRRTARHRGIGGGIGAVAAARRESSVAAA